MDLCGKIRRVLKEVFPAPSKIELRDEDGILGIIRSPRFRGKDFIDRQHLIWDTLGQNLSQEERKRIVSILAVTPEEEVAHLA